MRIEQAITLAAYAHDRQVDKVGVPYIYHLMRVMGTAPLEFAVPAVLHDILEDTSYTTAGLINEGVSPDDIHIVALVTRLKDHETYREYIARIVESGNEGALFVKQADLLDHLYGNPNPLRTKSMTERYRRAMDDINEALRLHRRNR